MNDQGIPGIPGIPGGLPDQPPFDAAFPILAGAHEASPVTKPAFELAQHNPQRLRRRQLPVSPRHQCQKRIAMRLQFRRVIVEALKHSCRASRLARRNDGGESGH